MADAEQEVAKHLATARRMHHLGVELDAEDAVTVRERRNRRVPAGRKQLKARRHLADVVTVAHPDREVAVQSAEKDVRLADRKKRGTVLAGMARVDLAAEVMRDELHAVADAEHRNP